MCTVDRTCAGLHSRMVQSSFRPISSLSSIGDFANPPLRESRCGSQDAGQTKIRIPKSRVPPSEQSTAPVEFAYDTTGAGLFMQTASMNLLRFVRFRNESQSICWNGPCASENGKFRFKHKRYAGIRSTRVCVDADVEISRAMDSHKEELGG
jgi:hypothetical protein